MNTTHRSVAFVTVSHRALCGVITVRIIFNTHAVSKGSCGKLAQSSQPSWRNCKVGCYFYQGFTFYLKKKKVFVVIFFSLYKVEYYGNEIGWWCLSFHKSKIIYIHVFFALFVLFARLIHNSVSIIPHKVVCFCRTGCNYSNYTSSKPFHLLWVWKTVSWLLLSGWRSCAIGSASGLSCCYSSVKSMT